MLTSSDRCTTLAPWSARTFRGSFCWRISAACDSWWPYGWLHRCPGYPETPLWMKHDLWRKAKASPWEASNSRFQFTHYWPSNNPFWPLIDHYWCLIGELARGTAWLDKPAGSLGDHRGVYHQYCRLDEPIITVGITKQLTVISHCGWLDWSLLLVWCYHLHWMI